jgi:hypothetical protein
MNDLTASNGDAHDVAAPTKARHISVRGWL